MSNATGGCFSKLGGKCEVHTKKGADHFRATCFVDDSGLNPSEVKIDAGCNGCKDQSDLKNGVLKFDWLGSHGGGKVLCHHEVDGVVIQGMWQKHGTYQGFGDCAGPTFKCVKKP